MRIQMAKEEKECKETQLITVLFFFQKEHEVLNQNFCSGTYTGPISICFTMTVVLKNRKLWSAGTSPLQWINGAEAVTATTSPLWSNDKVSTSLSPDSTRAHWKYKVIESQYKINVDKQ